MQIITPNEFSPFRSEIKRCPKCSSVFVDNTSCESCGYQLGHSALGEPLGDKSFYALTDQFWQSVSPMGVRLAFLENSSNPTTQKYKRALVHRYQVLVDYFLNSAADYTKTQHNQIFLVELNDLVKEMVRLEVPASVFWSPFNKDEDGLSSYLYRKVMMCFEQAQDEKNKLKDQHWSRRKYFGLIDLAQILRIGTFVMMVTSLGYALMNYLALQ